MSRERARRRAEREREQAIRAAARAREAERTQRAAARRRAMFGWLPAPRRQPGLLAQRRRRELTITVCLLLALNVLVWIVSRGVGGPHGLRHGQPARRARAAHPAVPPALSAAPETRPGDPRPRT